MDDEGFPLCPEWKEKVLPDEDDLCSLCGKHSASQTYFDHDTQALKWYNLAQLKTIKEHGNDKALA